MIQISIKDDFSETPWPRYIYEWDYSWELFYDSILKPKYLEAQKEGENFKIEIDLDDTYWYTSSFLSESFWNLYKDFWKEKIWSHLIIKSEEDPSLIPTIKKYTKDFE